MFELVSQAFFPLFATFVLGELLIFNLAIEFNLKLNIKIYVKMLIRA